jgi:hypothetical protein
MHKHTKSHLEELARLIHLGQMIAKRKALSTQNVSFANYVAQLARLLRKKG